MTEHSLRDDFSLAIKQNNALKFLNYVENVKRPVFITNQLRCHVNFDNLDFGAGALAILNEPNAGGSSDKSEALSIELFERAFGAQLEHTEMDIGYRFNNSKKTDYSMRLFNRLVIGVSVTRAMKFLGQFCEDDALELLMKKFEGVRASSKGVVSSDRWHKQILHVFTCCESNVVFLRAAFARLLHQQPKLVSNTVVVVTLARNAAWVFTNFASSSSSGSAAVTAAGHTTTVEGCSCRSHATLAEAEASYAKATEVHLNQSTSTSNAASRHSFESMAAWYGVDLVSSCANSTDNFQAVSVWKSSWGLIDLLEAPLDALTYMSIPRAQAWITELEPLQKEDDLVPPLAVQCGFDSFTTAAGQPTATSTISSIAAVNKKFPKKALLALHRLSNIKTVSKSLADRDSTEAPLALAQSEQGFDPHAQADQSVPKRSRLRVEELEGMKPVAESVILHNKVNASWTFQLDKLALEQTFQLDCLDLSCGTSIDCITAIPITLQAGYDKLTLIWFDHIRTHKRGVFELRCYTETFQADHEPRCGILLQGDKSSLSLCSGYDTRSNPE